MLRLRPKTFWSHLSSQNDHKNDDTKIENVVETLCDVSLLSGILVEMALFRLIFVDIFWKVGFFPKNMGHICKIWKKDGRLFTTHFLTKSNSKLNHKRNFSDDSSQRKIKRICRKYHLQFPLITCWLSITIPRGLLVSMTSLVEHSALCSTAVMQS